MKKQYYFSVKSYSQRIEDAFFKSSFPDAAGAGDGGRKERTPKGKGA